MDISGLGTYSSIPLGLDFSFNGGDYRGRKGSAGISLDLGKSTDSTGLRLSDEDKRLIRELQKRDQEVRAHERAHKTAAGSLARGSATYTYQIGPDGRRYAIGGEVHIDVSPGSTPEESLEKARRIRSAASAPSEPSAQDHSVASDAARLEAEARKELQENRREDGQSRSSLDGPVKGVSGPPELGGPAESVSGPPRQLLRGTDSFGHIVWPENAATIRKASRLRTAAEDEALINAQAAQKQAFAAQDAQIYGLEAADQASVDASFSIALNGRLADAHAAWQRGDALAADARFAADAALASRHAFLAAQAGNVAAVDPLRDGLAASGAAGTYPADRPSDTVLAAQGVQSPSAVSGAAAFTPYADQDLGSGRGTFDLSSGYLYGRNEEYSASALDLRRAAQAYADATPGTMLVPCGLGTGISLQV
ncbi:MAG TPA: hypothetical protein H9991_06295 [Candidatus Mailhella excrementigallinarum]|nr:hypothetical protein [Candidatus Mailhella excrementigallinarum]